MAREQMTFGKVVGAIAVVGLMAYGLTTIGNDQARRNKNWQAMKQRGLVYGATVSQVIDTLGPPTETVESGRDSSIKGSLPPLATGEKYLFWSENALKISTDGRTAGEYVRTYVPR